MDFELVQEVVPEAGWLVWFDAPPFAPWWMFPEGMFVFCSIPETAYQPVPLFSNRWWWWGRYDGHTLSATTLDATRPEPLKNRPPDRVESF